MQNTKHKHIQKGDIWLINNANAIGHMQQRTRPHVVVTQVTGETVTVLLFQSFAADISLLRERIGHLDENEIARLQLEYVKYVTD